jgi:hypothetical protein
MQLRREIRGAQEARQQRGRLDIVFGDERSALGRCAQRRGDRHGRSAEERAFHGLDLELGDATAREPELLANLGVGHTCGAQFGDGLTADLCEPGHEALVFGQLLGCQTRSLGRVADRFELFRRRDGVSPRVPECTGPLHNTWRYSPPIRRRHR